MILVQGADASSFLQGQLSQDLSDITPGLGVQSLLLNPDGKLVDIVGVHQVDGDLVLECDELAVELVLSRLKRFCFRVQVTMEVVPWTVRWWIDGTPPSGWSSRRAFGSGFLTIAASDLGSNGVTALSALDLERRRLQDCLPAFGAEITTETIPAELGTELVQRSVSFTKGCYTGQELVARLDARGANVPFHLRRITSSGILNVGDVFTDEQSGSRRGSVTSVIDSASGGVLGLGMFHRSIAVPTRLTTASGVVVEVEEIPQVLTD
ncbi:MAG: hypothetical protein WCL38_00945 [Actinomycetota bacterium]